MPRTQLFESPFLAKKSSSLKTNLYKKNHSLLMARGGFTQSHPNIQLQQWVGNQVVTQLSQGHLKNSYIGNQYTQASEYAANGVVELFGAGKSEQMNSTLQGKFVGSGVGEALQEELWESGVHVGLPHSLRMRLEALSGLNLSGIRVQYNSAQPAEHNALAFTQGKNILVGPGHEKYLPHEGWHVVQQMQGRVKPTRQENGVSINHNVGLEHEADVMGAKALQMTQTPQAALRCDPLGHSLWSHPEMEQDRCTSVKFGPAVQLKIKPSEIGNVDLFDYQFKPGEKPRIALVDAQRILRWKKEITDLLQKETGQSFDNDMRFLLVLAMKFTEQAGKVPVARPKGNNPFNIMGKGPAGSFFRPRNKEFEDGKHVLRPATFASYESEIQGTKAFLDILKSKWKDSFIAITQGGSVEDFAKGLRPEKGGHYLTKPLKNHIRDLKFRMSRLITDLEIIFSQSIEGTTNEIAELNPLLDFSLTHLGEGLLEDRKMRLNNAKVLHDRIVKLKALKEKFQAELADLALIRERIKKALPIQGPIEN